MRLRVVEPLLASSLLLQVTRADVGRMLRADALRLSLGPLLIAVGLAAMVFSLVLTMTMGTAVALLLSAANVFMRDISSAVNILTNLVRFGVPMIYPYTLVDDRFGAAANYYLWNPLANAAEQA